MYWKTRVRQLKGVSIDEEVLEKRQSLHNIEVPNEVTIEIAKEKLAQAKAHWDEFKENGYEWRKQYLMDHAKNKIPEEDLNEKQKDRIIKSVSKQMKQQNTFKYLTTHIERGAKNSLKKLHIINENEQIINTLVNKEKIEEAISQHNTSHYKQAMQTTMYQDQIYNKLQDNEVRNDILDGNLQRSQCDDEDVYQFLTLLKQPENQRRIEN